VKNADLKPEPRIRELLLSSSTTKSNADDTVVLLDCYAALGPKSAMHAGLGEVVQEEFEALLRKAKEEKRAVVFHLGGFDPWSLARKVYMRPRFAQYGLKVGYLRWRAGPTKPWERQKKFADRPLLGLQLS
jgi:hypothetical protein